MNRTQPMVDDLFCLAVYGASHVINQRYAPLLRPLKLTYPQYITLLILQEQDDMRVSAIGEKLRMGTSTVTPLLKRLESLGHVERRRSANDEREVRVQITAKGRSLLKSAPEITSCMIRDTKMDITKLKNLVMSLNTLCDGLHKSSE